MGILQAFKGKIQRFTHEWNPATGYGRQNIKNKSILTKEGREYRAERKQVFKEIPSSKAYVNNPTQENYDRMVKEAQTASYGFKTEAERQAFLKRVAPIVPIEQMRKKAEKVEAYDEELAVTKHMRTVQLTLSGKKTMPTNVKSEPKDIIKENGSSLLRGVRNMAIKYNTSQKNYTKIMNMTPEGLMKVYNTFPDVFTVYFDKSDEAYGDNELVDDPLQKLVRTYEETNGVLSGDME